MFSCQNKSRTPKQFWHFSISKETQLRAIRVTERRPILLTKSKINRPVINFLSIFAKNGQLNLVLVLVLESKGP